MKYIRFKLNYTKKNLGISLVGLLVGATLGILVSLGIVQIFSNTQANFTVVSQANKLQEQFRFAAIMLGKLLQQVNYDAVSPSVSGTYAASYEDTFTMYVRGNATGRSKDCSGAVIAEGDIAEMIFMLGFSGSLPVLQCYYKNPIAGAQSSIDLVQGVEAMQVKFGEIRGANRGYFSANDVSDWNNVFAARLALVIRSVKPTSNIDVATTSTLLNGSTHVTNDKYMRKVLFVSSRVNDL